MKPYNFKPSSRRPLDPRSERVLCLAMALVLGGHLIAPALSAAEPQSATAQRESTTIDPTLVDRWDSRYQQDRRPAWDTGRPSPHLMRLVEDETLETCRVVELGSGTGVNAVYLAKQGFQVTAIDVAPTALKLAEQRATEAGVKVEWIQADVLTPPPLKSYDLIFDRGCYHGVRRQDPSRYVEVVKKLCRPGGRVLILAGNANEPGDHYGPPRVDEQELVNDFAGAFDFEELREIRFDTSDPDVQGALAWAVLLRRKGDVDTAP